ncbi:xyloglucan galactosyltransferase MUR3 [Tanacetum coccineum]
MAVLTTSVNMAVLTTSVNMAVLTTSVNMAVLTTSVNMAVFSPFLSFHKLKQYECLTNESSLASAIFVPFYAGLDATRGYNISVRDAASIELVEWLQKRDEWKTMHASFLKLGLELVAHVHGGDMPIGVLVYWPEDCWWDTSQWVRCKSVFESLLVGTVPVSASLELLSRS